MSRQAPPLAARLLFALAVLAASFLAGEMLVRTASVFLPGVRYLSTFKVDRKKITYGDLEEFLLARHQLVPFREWQGYANNSLGFNDRDFDAPVPGKAPRLMGLGDSFTFSIAPYPAAALTLAEETLGEQCGVDLEYMNMGIPDSGVWEYKTLLDLAGPVYRPDTVVVHFYLGNDGPDLFRHDSELPFKARRSNYSHLVTYLKNLRRLGKAVDREREAAPRGKAVAERDAKARGGEAVGTSPPAVNPDDPALKGPIYREEVFVTVMAAEMGRLYDPGRDVLTREWRPVIETLELMRLKAHDLGADLHVILYPSRLQVDRGFREMMVEKIRGLEGYRELRPDLVDPFAPNRMVMEYCRRAAVDCFDLTGPLLDHVAKFDDDLYMIRDTHWNVAGNRVAGLMEAGYLVEAVCPKEGEAGDN